MRKHIAFFAITILILLAACAKDPKDLYLSYIKKSQDLKEYKIVYTFQMEMLQAFGASDIKVGIFKKNDKEKAVAEIRVLGQSVTSSAYKLDGKMISCIKSTGSFSSMSPAGTNEVVCKRGADQNEFSQFEDLTSVASSIESKDLVILSLKESEVMDRKCDNFVLDVKNISKLMNSSGDSLFGYDPYSNLQFKMEVCMDKKTSLLLKVKLFTKSKSELDEQSSEKEFFIMTATSLSDKVEDSVFEIPVAFSVLGSACDKKEAVAVIESYKDFSGQVSLKGGTLSFDRQAPDTATILKTVQKSIKKGSTETMMFDLSKASVASQYPSYEICFGDDCQILNCYSGSKECLKKSTSKTTCESDKECVFFDDVCVKFSCSVLKNEASCKANSACNWKSGFGAGYCFEKYCGDFKTEGECKSSRLGCAWKADQYGTYCTQKSCYDLIIKAECESSTLKCEWAPTSLEGVSQCQPLSCYNKQTEAQCAAMEGCRWLVDQYGVYCTTSFDNINMAIN